MYAVLTLVGPQSRLEEQTSQISNRVSQTGAVVLKGTYIESTWLSKNIGLGKCSAPRPEGANAESRGDRNVDLRLRYLEPESRLNTAGYGRSTTRCFSDASAGENESANTTFYPFFANALLRTKSKSVETTVRRRRLLFAVFVARMGGERLPKRVIFEEMVAGQGLLRKRGVRLDVVP